MVPTTSSGRLPVTSWEHHRTAASIPIAAVIERSIWKHLVINQCIGRDGCFIHFFLSKYWVYCQWALSTYTSLILCIISSPASPRSHHLAWNSLQIWGQFQQQMASLLWKLFDWIFRICKLKAYEVQVWHLGNTVDGRNPANYLGCIKPCE